MSDLLGPMVPALARLGAVEVPRPHYRRMLVEALRPPDP